ncbi:putative glucose-6-phosphate 1-epimerase [Rubripirellula tenax]|uniref:Putative glucose-6-phosphate 1-epimerase n=1 Tax=Rubripirellula tenax TaxID=2528015 RepID=A0A5C6FC84_9BACT|nr:D-hexose-6-phosphate mutarotase [Rubripirellula tenax]TWU59058.1 putative glucose-6-phosphate 1-epimerase [Rubripirellula tenax]
MKLEDLNQRFGIAEVKFVAGQGGLIKAVVTSDQCEGEIYIHGAHVTHFQPTNQKPVLWMSEQSVFEAEKAIRGGVPICFPWFGPLAGHPKAPGHGWARTRSWDVVKTSLREGNVVELVMRTEIEDFALAYTVRFGEVLSLELHVTLSPQAAATVTYEEAMHTYLTVSDIHSVSIRGLEPAGYIDKVDGGTTKMETGSAIRFDGECDRVYLETTSTTRLTDPGMKRIITISKSHSHNTVVWNPWVDKSARMPDFGDNEWQGMVCIETANIGKRSIELKPGKSHTMTATIAVDQLD